MVKLRVENETKAGKFKRIASSRTNRILKVLRLLGNCSNRNLYSYTRMDVEKVFGAIQKEMNRVRSMFDEGKVEFSLD